MPDPNRLPLRDDLVQRLKTRAYNPDQANYWNMINDYSLADDLRAAAERIEELETALTKACT